MFYNCDFYKNYFFSLSLSFFLCFSRLLCFFFSYFYVPSYFSSLITKHLSRQIGPNEARSRGRTNRSRIGISTIQRIWVRAVRNSSPSFLPHASDPFPPSDPPRSIDPDSWFARSFSRRYTFLCLPCLRGGMPPSYRNRQCIMSYGTQSV